MSKVVFISHAGTDFAKAVAVANFLRQADIEARYGRTELCIGDSFLTFIESALTDADYCLLLWSQSAAQTEWVRLEWESALYKSVVEKRSFLIVGRIEDVALPALLSPRIAVDLFPDLELGIGQIIHAWRADRETEAKTGRLVASPSLVDSALRGQATLYVTSDLFGITVPVRANLEEPAGVYVDKIVSTFGLPRVFNHAGRLGINFEYRFIHNYKPLERAKPLLAQGIKNMGILWLETTIMPYAQTEASRGTIRPIVFRGNACSSKKQREKVEALAREAFVAAVERNGLGRTKASPDIF